MKITSGDVTTRVPAQLFRRSLAFYHGKVPGFAALHYVCLSMLFSSHFNAFFTVCHLHKAFERFNNLP